MSDKLQAALRASETTLTVARDFLPAFQEHRERCGYLVRRCQQLLELVSEQTIEVRERLGSGEKRCLMLQNACVFLKRTMAELIEKGFAWRLLHRDGVDMALVAASEKILSVFATFHDGSSHIKAEFRIELSKAAQADEEALLDHLMSILENDQKMLEALKSRGATLEETLTAFRKHLQARTRNTGDSDRLEEFMYRVVETLQRHLTEMPDRLMPWQLTNLEIEYGKSEDDCLGVGGYGKVFKGSWNGELVAVKEMHQSVGPQRRNDKHLKSFEREMKIWLRLNHPRIIPFYGACLEAEKPFLVTKYCPFGNVMDYLREWPEVDRQVVLHEVAVGMAYLHSQCIIHADLKASNILIGEDHKALICDFGLSQLKDQALDSEESDKVFGVQGTLNYMAPEYLDGNPIDYSVDVYSFAMTAWQIYSGLIPFSEVPRRAFYRWIIERQERPEFPNSMNAVLWDVVQECWDNDASKRPTFVQVEASLRILVDPYRGFGRHLSPAKELITATESTHFQMITPPVTRELRTSASPSAADNSLPDRVGQPNRIGHRNAPTSSGDSSSEYSISNNSIEAFRRCLENLGEAHSFDKYIHIILTCYSNWIKYKVFTARGQRPRHILKKNRVKLPVKQFKKAILSWVDSIPAVRKLEASDGYRTLLLVTGVCSVAEYCDRQNSDAPHLYVREFISNAINSNYFRSKVEEGVSAAWKDFRNNEIDKVGLEDRLVDLVNRVSTL